MSANNGETFLRIVRSRCGSLRELASRWVTAARRARNARAPDQFSKRAAKKKRHAESESRVLEISLPRARSRGRDRGFTQSPEPPVIYRRNEDWFRGIRVRPRRGG